MRFSDPGLDHKRVTNFSLRTNFSHFAHLQVGVLNGTLQNQDTGYQDPSRRGTQTHVSKSKYCQSQKQSSPVQFSRDQTSVHSELCQYRAAEEAALSANRCAN